MAVSIDDVDVSIRVLGKINSDHGVTLDDVEDALDDVIHSVWDDDYRGRRLYVWGRSGRRTIFVCLWPVNADTGHFRLGTAYPDPYP